MKTIDINCDLGEGIVDDAQLMPLISSCNIACGGHAGHVNSMRELLLMAKRHGVRPGAHPSYPDKANFGRKAMDMAGDDLYHTLKEQIWQLYSMAGELGVQLYHVKPHGALYHKASQDPQTASIIANAVAAVDHNLAIYAPVASAMEGMALAKGLKFVPEAFLDRSYQDDLSLVPRSHEHAVLESPQDVLDQLLMMVEQGKVTSISAEVHAIDAQTFCIHGDHPKAITLVRFLNEELPKYNLKISKY